MRCSELGARQEKPRLPVPAPNLRAPIDMYLGGQSEERLLQRRDVELSMANFVCHFLFPFLEAVRYSNLSPYSRAHPEFGLSGPSNS